MVNLMNFCSIWCAFLSQLLHVVRTNGHWKLINQKKKNENKRKNAGDRISRKLVQIVETHV
jgi:hypothetical protein